MTAPAATKSSVVDFEVTVADTHFVAVLKVGADTPDSHSVGFLGEAGRG